MTKQINVSKEAESEFINKRVASSQTGKGSTIIVDQLGLALMLMNIYGQELQYTDWTLDRGDMYVFDDNPTVRTCVALWKMSYKQTDIMSVIERFLFNLLDDATLDAFIELEQIEAETRSRREEIKKQYGV